MPVAHGGRMPTRGVGMAPGMAPGFFQGMKFMRFGDPTLRLP